MPKPTAAYLRISVLTGDSVSIEGQRNLARKIAEERGSPPPVIFEDSGVSATGDVRRPARDELESRLAAGEFAALIVKSVDRLARSAVDFHRIAKLCSDAGCDLVVSDMNLDTSTASGRMTLGILAQIAEFEAALIGERVRRSNIERVRVGRVTGGTPPYGFCNRRAESGGTYRVVDEGQAAVVRRIAEDVLAGKSLASIARALSAETDTGSWEPISVRRAVENPAVSGQTRRLGDVVRDEATGLPRVDETTTILDYGTWRRVLDELATRSNRPQTRASYADRPLLDGLAVCASCNKALTRSSSTGGGTRRYVTYTCGRRGRNRCPHGARAGMDALDRLVTDWFLSRFGNLAVVVEREGPDPTRVDALEQTRAEVQHTVAQMSQVSTDQIDALSDRLKNLREHEERLRRELEDYPEVTMLPTDTTIGEAWHTSDDISDWRELLAGPIAKVSVGPATVDNRRIPLAERVDIITREDSEDYDD